MAAFCVRAINKRPPLNEEAKPTSHASLLRGTFYYQQVGPIKRCLSCPYLTHAGRHHPQSTMKFLTDVRIGHTAPLAKLVPHAIESDSGE